MSYYYPRHDPKWSHADSARWANAEQAHVDVVIWQGTENEKTFRNCEVGNHNKFGATDRSDVIVEDGAFGWRCIWFMNTEVQPPYAPGSGVADV